MISEDVRKPLAVSESLPAQEALERLRAGNRRFVAGGGARERAREQARRLHLVDRQAPFAIILGCSDSRVPAELVFDQGLGDLFVIRVAGNIVAPSQVGSIEFAAERFGTQLVVVLGHTQCGAVAAAIEELECPDGVASSHLAFIVGRIRPAVEPLLGRAVAAAREADPDAFAAAAVRANIRASVDQLQESSSMLRGLVREGNLRIVGAEYALETGEVTFLKD